MAHPKPQAVRDFIQRTFGTVARYADLTDQPVTKVRNVLKRVACQDQADLLAAARQHKKDGLHKRPASFELKPADLDALRSYIDAQHAGNVSAFSRATNIDFTTVSQLLYSKRKRATELVVAVLAAANVPGYSKAA